MTANAAFRMASPVISVAGSGQGDSGPGAGAVAMIAGGAYVVSGVVESAAGVVEILLSAVSSGAKLPVKISGKTVDAAGLSVGTTVSVVSETTGTLLVASGKVIAFIPNQLGEALQAALDASGEDVALIARQGQDLSKYRLKYPHAGRAYRPAPGQPWRVVELLNDCGTVDSASCGWPGQFLPRRSGRAAPAA